MEMVILKKYQDVSPYIRDAIRCADQHKNELGFLTPSAYEEQALEGRLWICIDQEEKKYLGHLLFGGKYPSLKVFQLLVHPDYRKMMIPYPLISELADYGTKHSYLNISARVAEDLEADRLWSYFGFKLVRQVPGGKARRRVINIRSKELETTSLLSLIEVDKKNDSNLLRYGESPILGSNQYILDLNVLLDIARNRVHRKQASSIVRAAMNNYMRVAVTDELVRELKRTNNGRILDPLLELACELPSIRVEDKSKLSGMIDELRGIIFPDRSPNRKHHVQDDSDLMHIATCIINKVEGFITREKAILRAKDTLFSKYNLEILSPQDVDEPNEYQKFSFKISSSTGSKKTFAIHSVTDTDFPDIRDFLQSFKLQEGEIDRVCKKGTTGASRQIICMSDSDKIIGMASWDTPPNITKETSAYLLINEDHQFAEKAIDHALESITRNNNSNARKIVLYFASDQYKTKSTALKRGFRSTGVAPDTIFSSMVKVSFSGIISLTKWPSFSRKFFSLTKLSLPVQMPIPSSVDDKCFRIVNHESDVEIKLSLFELETLVSPAVIFPIDRSAILLPIRPNHATDLGICSPRQTSFLAKQEAFLHVEKAYFRKNSRSNLYKRGMLLLFYISKKGEYSQYVVGSARITYSEACSLDVIKGKFYRQGVLPLQQLQELCDKNGLVHCITFDNFCSFNNPVPFHKLKNDNHISKLNLVTGEPQNNEQTKAILELGFNRREA